MPDACSKLQAVRGAFVKLVADTHVHIYPCYPIAEALSRGLDNLRRLAGTSEAACALFLTERFDCRVYRDLSAGRLGVQGWDVSQPLDADVIRLVRKSDGGKLLLFAGRQIITSERIEVLALTRDLSVPDGVSAAETIEAVSAGGAIPVLPWSPGKWFFGRGRLIAGIIGSASPAGLLVGDSSLRPIGWPHPRLMTRARARGIGIVAGSDPLPFAGEERLIGTYGTSFECETDNARPADSARKALLAPGANSISVGERTRPVTLARRLWLNARSKRRMKDRG